MTRGVLVIGGAGMIGSHIAEHLAGQGDRVTIASRRAEGAFDPPQIAGLARVAIDYTDEDLVPQALENYTDIVFSAGNDLRHVAPEDANSDFWATVQSEGVPRFAQLAKQAGVQRLVQIGSYYHQLNPAWAETDLYIGARKVADDKTRDLVGGGFQPITLNPPSIVGAIPGRSLRGFQKLIAWVRGEVEGPERYAPAGGTNYMSVRSLSQAVAGALDSGEAGKAYLVGDRNLRYNEYYNLLAEVSNSPHRFEERDEEHPFLPDRFIVQGRGNAIVYEPELAVQKLLAFDRDDVERALRAIVEAADAL